jgi:hypothetical protein
VRCQQTVGCGTHVDRGGQTRRFRGQSASRTTGDWEGLCPTGRSRRGRTVLAGSAERLQQGTASQPLGLLPAYQLYANSIYGKLVDRFGLAKVYILSAGWGLIAADFLTPYYDITFSQSAEPYKRRRKTDYYRDFRMLQAEPSDEILLFAGKDYLPLFNQLTRGFGRRVVFYNSAIPPRMDGCILKRFETATRTNWHYECAMAVLNGKISAS